jgi:hypothetical protein
VVAEPFNVNHSNGKGSSCTTSELGTGRVTGHYDSRVRLHPTTGTKVLVRVQETRRQRPAVDRGA